MDGIARDTAGFDSTLTEAFMPLGIATVVGCGVLLTIALVIEVLRRGGVAEGIVRRFDRMTPAPARHLAAATLSLVVALTGPAPSYASEAPVRDWLSGSTTTTTAAAVATEGALIERSDPTPPPTSTPTAAAPVPVSRAPGVLSLIPPTEALPIEMVVVAEGDCLWSIAARWLPSDSGNAVIDAAWRAIYALNRTTIGDDPNLIFPGEQLVLPPIEPLPHAAP